MIYLDDAINTRHCINGHIIKKEMPHFREQHLDRGFVNHTNWCLQCGIKEIQERMAEYKSLLDSISIFTKKEVGSEKS